MFEEMSEARCGMGVGEVAYVNVHGGRGFVGGRVGDEEGGEGVSEGDGFVMAVILGALFDGGTAAFYVG